MLNNYNGFIPSIKKTSNIIQIITYTHRVWLSLLVMLLLCNQSLSASSNIYALALEEEPEVSNYIDGMKDLLSPEALSQIEHQDSQDTSIVDSGNAKLVKFQSVITQESQQNLLTLANCKTYQELASSSLIANLRLALHDEEPIRNFNSDTAGQFLNNAKRILNNQQQDQEDIGLIQWLEDGVADKSKVAARTLGWLYFYGEYSYCDLAKGVQWLEKAAAQEDLISMVWLGYLYTNLVTDYVYSFGLEDPKKALEKFLLLADKYNLPYGQCFAGCMYFFGNGVEKDKNKGQDLLNKSLQAGYICAQSVWGDIYYYSLEGIPQDFKKAAEFYLQANAQDPTFCTVKLGDMYFKGLGLPKDITKAIEHYKRADSDDPLALQGLGNVYYSKKHELRNIETAIDYYKSAAIKGSTHAQYRLGKIGLKKGSETISLKDAENFLLKAATAENGSIKAGYLLGRAKIYGTHNVTIDINLGVSLLEDIGNKGCLPAQKDLGQIFFNKDDSRAFFWYDKAAEQGDIESSVTAGYMAAKGQGTIVDIAKSLKYLHYAADQHNHREAQSLLGDIYYGGIGGADIDMDKSISFYTKAQANGRDIGEKLRQALLAKQRIEEEYARSHSLIYFGRDGVSINPNAVSITGSATITITSTDASGNSNTIVHYLGN